MKPQSEEVEGLPYHIHAPSSIHGHGAVASRRIHKGELVAGAPAGSGFGGFNHSCDPNLGDRVEKDTPLRPALRNIRKGEELTVSYKRLNGHLISCNCQTCLGREPPYVCNCPRHQRLSWIPPALVLGTGLILSGFLFQLEEIWVDKLQLPKFWKRS